MLGFAAANAMSAEGRTDPALSRNPKPPPLGGGEFTPRRRRPWSASARSWRTRRSIANVMIDGAARIHSSENRCPVFSFTARDGPQRVVRQRPLKIEGLGRIARKPKVDFLRRRQDRCHGLRMNWCDG